MIGFKQKVIVATSILVASIALILTGIFFYRHLHKNNIPIAPPPPQDIKPKTEFRKGFGYLHDVDLND